MSIPSHHANTSRTLFRNPWHVPEEVDENSSAYTSSKGSWIWQLPALLTNIPIEWARDLTGSSVSAVQVVKPDFDLCRTTKASTIATWLGHASFLVELLPTTNTKSGETTRLLFDPVFSDFAGPSAWTCIRRRLPPPCTIEDLPDVDYVLISHNHYDHLDIPSVQKILQLRGTAVTFIVPLGIKSLLVSNNIPRDQIHEMDWWDETTFPASKEKMETSRLTSLKVTCVPAQHTSGRSMLDRLTTLWSGWVITQTSIDADVRPGANDDVRIYHAGDTGYMGTNGPCPAFKEIGERYGPFDLAMIPIWRGGTLSFISSLGLRLTHHPLLSALHASPADAVSIHRAVRSRHTLAMHFATFAGSDAEALEPVIELAHAREAAALGDWMDDYGIGVIDVGQTVEISPEDTETGASSPPGPHAGLPDA